MAAPHGHLPSAADWAQGARHSHQGMSVVYQIKLGKCRDVEDEDVPADVMEAQLSVAVSPLAVPMIAGPGTIATAVGFSAHPGFLSSIISISAFAVIAAITYFSFQQARRIVHYMGTTNLTVVTRLMGLIVATIGVEMAMTGLDEALIKYMDTIRSLPLPPPTG